MCTLHGTCWWVRHMILCWTPGWYMIHGQYIIHCVGHVGIIEHIFGTRYMGNAWHLLTITKGIGTTQLHGICMKPNTPRWRWMAKYGSEDDCAMHNNNKDMHGSIDEMSMTNKIHMWIWRRHKCVQMWKSNNARGSPNRLYSLLPRAIGSVEGMAIHAWVLIMCVRWTSAHSVSSSETSAPKCW